MDKIRIYIALLFCQAISLILPVQAQNNTGSDSNRYNTLYSYDCMGNITSLSRNGLLDDGSYDYYPYGGLMSNSTGWNTQRYKYNGKEFDRMHGLDWYDYGARWMDAAIGRWHVIDPLCEKYYDVSPYNYCRNNPVMRIDPNGKWDVNVHLSTDRSANGYGVAVVSDRNGQEIFKFIVRAEGVKGHNRMLTGADTLLGVYDIPDNNAWINGGERVSYGPNERLVMIPESGEIVESGRNDIRMHGGRQEKKNPDGTWSKKYTGLKKTYGCLRASDEYMKTFKAFTDYLESTDDLEKAGKVIVKDDIEQYNKNTKDDLEQYSIKK